MPRGGGASRKVVNFQFPKYIYIAREGLFGRSTGIMPIPNPWWYRLETGNHGEGRRTPMYKTTPMSHTHHPRLVLETAHYLDNPISR